MNIALHVLLVRWIPFLQLLKDANLYLTSIAIFGNGADNLDGNPLACFGVDGFNNLPECPLTQQPYSPIWMRRSVGEVK